MDPQLLFWSGHYTLGYFIFPLRVGLKQEELITIFAVNSRIIYWIDAVGQFWANDDE